MVSILDQNACARSGRDGDHFAIASFDVRPMTSLLQAAFLLFVAAISPGPNNLLVMRITAFKGWRGALPAVAGILMGGLVLLFVVVTGSGKAFGEWPWLRRTIELGGVICLVFLGARLFVTAGDCDRAMPLPSGLFGLFGFQFLNPKGWVLVLTVVTAVHAPDPTEALLRLMPLFIVIPAACLLLWAGLGGAMASRITRPAVRTWTDRTLGALLVVAALLLLV